MTWTHDERARMVADADPLIRGIAYNFVRQSGLWAYEDDLIQELRVKAWELSETHDPGRGPFRACAANYLKKYILDRSRFVELLPANRWDDIDDHQIADKPREQLQHDRDTLITKALDFVHSRSFPPTWTGKERTEEKKHWSSCVMLFERFVRGERLRDIGESIAKTRNDVWYRCQEVIAYLDEHAVAWRGQEET